MGEETSARTTRSLSLLPIVLRFSLNLPCHPRPDRGSMHGPLHRPIIVMGEGRHAAAGPPVKPGDDKRGRRRQPEPPGRARSCPSCCASLSTYLVIPDLIGDPCTHLSTTPHTAMGTCRDATAWVLRSSRRTTKERGDISPKHPFGLPPLAAARARC